MSSQKTIAFWDFDGTLTKSDSFWAFLVYTQSWAKLAIGALRFAPMLAAFKLGWVSNAKAKLKLLKFFFGGWEAKKYQILCEGFANEKLPQLLHPEAFKKFQWHLSEGHEVVLVSASLETYLAPWCAQYNIQCLATKLWISGGLVLAEYEYPNCYGPEKERRIRAQFDLDSYERIYAYGNSGGDNEMLALAHEKFYQEY